MPKNANMTIEPNYFKEQMRDFGFSEFKIHPTLRNDLSRLVGKRV